MDLLILILGVPAILIPLVLLFGFAGCCPVASPCTDDLDCPAGTQCTDGQCFSASPGEANPPPPSAPENLAAIARDDQSVSLTWINTDPAATDFRIERMPEDGDEFVAIPAPADLSAAGATDASSGLQEGVTFIYRVRALVGEQASGPSDTSAATVLPAAPLNLAATPAGINQIDVSWDNGSLVATEFSLEHRVPGGPFLEIFRGTATRISDPRPVEGTHEYRVSAIVVDGFENDAQQDVKSAAAIALVTFAFNAAFTAPPGTLTTDDPSAQGLCVVQRLSQALLTAGGSQVRIQLRGSTTGSLTFDKITISQPAATGDPYDAAPDLTDVASGVTIAANTTVTVGPVNYTLDRTRDLLIAFDISNTPGEGNTRFGALTGGRTFVRSATAEAGVPDRTTGYVETTDNLAFVEKIEVL